MFGFADSLEAILKHELERHEVKYSDSASLGSCIDRAMGDILPGKVSYSIRHGKEKISEMT